MTCRFCGEEIAPDDLLHVLDCDGRQGATEAAIEQHTGAATYSTEEAMALLNRTRRQQIDCARAVARRLIAAKGRTHSREVRDVMAAEGTLDLSIPDYWLGAVFRSREFAWTGDWYLPAVPPGDQNIHAWRPVKVWGFGE